MRSFRPVSGCGLPVSGCGFCKRATGNPQLVYLHFKVLSPTSYNLISFLSCTELIRSIRLQVGIYIQFRLRDGQVLLTG